jgi:hypothetical protein
MVPAAEKQEIVEAGRAAVGPVTYVVGVGEPVGAPREAAPAVAFLQRAPDRHRNRAPRASDVEHGTGVVVGHDDAARIASQAAGRFRGKMDAAGEHRLAGFGVDAESFGVDVEHDLDATQAAARTAAGITDRSGSTGRARRPGAGSVPRRLFRSRY